MRPNIHILGIQGSGKGTQSALLEQRYDFSYISSGDLFRKRAAQGDEFGLHLQSEMNKGTLISNESLFRTVEDFLQAENNEAGLLADGVIRTIDQYRGLQSSWLQYDLDEPVLIHLILSEEIALERIEQRKRELEDESKREYHLKYSGKLLKRTDDNPKAIQERFALFHAMTEPIIDVFEQQHRCVHIRADQPIDRIHAQICKALIRFYPTLGNVPD